MCVWQVRVSREAHRVPDNYLKASQKFSGWKGREGHIDKRERRSPAWRHEAILEEP